MMSKACSANPLPKGYGPGLPRFEILGRSANPSLIVIEALTKNPGTDDAVSSKTKLVAEAGIARRQYKPAAIPARALAKLVAGQIRIMVSREILLSITQMTT